MVGVHEAFEVRTIFHHHRAVGAEAAGRHDDTFGLHVDDLLFIVDKTHAAHFVVAHQDLFYRGIQQHINTAFGDITHQTANQVAANRRSVARTVGTVDTHPAGGGDIVKHNPTVRQPFNGLRRVFNETAQQLRVVFVVAALQGFLIEQLFTVLNTFDALEAGFCGVHPGGSFDGVAANSRHFFDDQHAGAFVVGLNRRRQTGAAAPHHHNVIAFRRGIVAALFRCQRFAGFQHRFGHRFFHRFALAGRAGDSVDVRRVGGQNTFADLFEAGGKFNALHRACGQLNIRNAIVFEADVNDQFVGIVLNGFDKHPRFKFRVAHAHVADHRFDQRETPQRFRNMQRLALGAVDKEFQLFAGGDT